jgi:hypothetical protein
MNKPPDDRRADVLLVCVNISQEFAERVDERLRDGNVSVTQLWLGEIESSLHVQRVGTLIYESSLVAILMSVPLTELPEREFKSLSLLSDILYHFKSIGVGQHVVVIEVGDATLRKNDFDLGRLSEHVFNVRGDTLNDAAEIESSLHSVLAMRRAWLDNISRYESYNKSYKGTTLSGKHSDIFSAPASGAAPMEPPSRAMPEESDGAVEVGAVEVAGAEEVTCSVFSPRLAAPGDEILIQAYAHLEEQEKRVASMAVDADLAASLRGRQQLAEPIARGSKLGFHLRMRGVEIDETDIVRVWRGEPLAAQFGVFLPEDFQPRGLNATVQVTKDGVPIGHIKFTLQVVTRAEKQSAGSVRERLGTLSRYGEAFISYASADRPEVLPMVQALSAAKIKVFQDILELDPGDRWERELYKHIDTCDAFFLFWSNAAKASSWVLKETLYARDRQKGEDNTPPEIIPIIIEGPPPVSPPPELNFLHFNDKFIYLRKGVEAEAEARRKDD